MTKQQVKEAREWLLDCASDESARAAGWDSARQFVRSLTDVAIERTLEANYEGGVAAFIADGAPR